MEAVGSPVSAPSRAAAVAGTPGRSTPSAGRVWALELPFTAPMSLNDRMIWPVKAKITKEWVDATLVLTKHAKIPKLGKISVLLVYEPRDRRVRDPLNLVQSLKAVEDGIVRAGVVPDDNPLYVESRMPVILEKGPGHASGRFWAVVTEIS